jgi:hypothetical protein
MFSSSDSIPLERPANCGPSSLTLRVAGPGPRYHHYMLHNIWVDPDSCPRLAASCCLSRVNSESAYDSRRALEISVESTQQRQSWKVSEFTQS